MSARLLDPSALDPRRTIASVFLLPDCDMGCRFCASEAGFEAMPPDTAGALVEELAASGFHSVVLGGGEPFLWPHDLAALGRRARRAGLLVQVGSNVLAPPPGFAAFDWVDRYLVPWESSDPALHDELRAARGGHAVALERALDALTESGKPVTVGTVVTARNLDGLTQLREALLARAARGLRVHAWHLYRFLAVGRGGAGAAGLHVGSAEYRAAVDGLRAEPLGFPVYRRDDMLRSTTVEFFWQAGGRIRTGSESAGGAAG